jgi:hypothetical protein
METRQNNQSKRTSDKTKQPNEDKTKKTKDTLFWGILDRGRIRTDKGEVVCDDIVCVSESRLPLSLLLFYICPSCFVFACL